MDFSLFDEAARDYDAEAAERRTAIVRSAVQAEIFPFLAMAATPAEYVHRKALAAERLVSIAQRCDASPQEVEGAADRMYTLLAQSRQRTVQALPGRTAKAAPCANCDHAGTDHSEGLRCQCGCTNYQPAEGGTGQPSGHNASRKEARRVTADGEGSGPFS